MEESGAFEYWFTFLFALGFCLWFPTYVVKTRGKSVPTWGLSFCIVILFLFLPLLAMSLIRDVLPSVWMSFTSQGHEAPNVSLILGTLRKMARLDQLYVCLATISILIAMGQSAFASWLIYVRHNRESLMRAIRIMWCSALFVVLAAGVLPYVILGAHGLSIVLPSALTMAAYIAVLMGITAYLRMSNDVANHYPISHSTKKAK